MSDEPKAESGTVDSLVGRWVPVDEFFPTPRELVLFVSEGTVYVGHKESGNPDSLMWKDHMRIDRDGDFYDVWNVTHWMPIPLPPNTKNERQQ